MATEHSMHTQTDHPPIQVIQVSDPHLFKDTNSCLLGMNTQQSFEQVLDLIQRNHHSIDLVLATGDIAQSPAMETYARFYQLLSTLGAPQHWLQGNHDLDQLFLDGSIPHDCHSPNVIAQGNWRIIMLNSSEDHQVAGYFSRQELEWLQDALQSTIGFHTVVALHHHPIAVGSRWLDAHMLTESFQFWRMIEQYPQVRSVLHGHVHQVFETARGHTSIYACPSTCIQFKPLSREFALDRVPPGYRWLTLHANGRIETGVHRLAEIPSGVDFLSLGY